MNKLVNAMLFNVMWFGCVYFGNAFTPLVLIWLLIHLVRVKATLLEIQLLGSVVIIGTVLDTTLMHNKVFLFPPNTIAITSTFGLIPFWLIMIWLSFALTINASLSFLKNHKGLQFLIGAVLAPTSYFIGAKMDAVSFSFSPYTTFALLSAIWGLLLVGLFMLVEFYHRSQYDQVISVRR